MEKVALDTDVHDLIERHPELTRVFEAHDLLLDVQCLDNTYNTLEDVAAICGFDPQEMMDDLNTALENAGAAAPG